MWSNTPRPPQEPPPESESSSGSSETAYLYSSEEEIEGRPDAVEHVGPWLSREALATGNSQDGSFDNTSSAQPEEAALRLDLLRLQEESLADVVETSSESNSDSDPSVDSGQAEAPPQQTDRPPELTR